MERISGKRSAGSFPMVVGLTALVLLAPCLAAIGLRHYGIVTSPLLLILVPVLLSMGISWLIAEIWKRRTAGSPFLFDDLMIWGWVRNRRFERLLGRSEEFISPDPGQDADPRGRARELERLSAALEARDPRTHGHSRRVSRHAARIARALKLPSEEIARIRTAALLHDVGKIRIPTEIVEKPGALTDEEYEVIKTHSAAGAELVAGMGDPGLTSIVRHHHERIDGGGYPDGLAGEEIPLGARIIAVADTFDALTSARSYRAPRSHEEALKVLGAEAGAQLDADAVRVFERRYSGRRPVALGAALLGLGRQAGQSLIGLGTGASQVAAVGAAAVVIGASPAANLDRHGADKAPATDRRAPVTVQATGTDPAGAGVAGTGGGAPSGDRDRPRGERPGAGGQVRPKAPGANPSPGTGGDPEPGDTGGGSDSSSGGSDGSTGGGSGGSSGGGTAASGAEAVRQTVQKVTQTVTDAVPTLPGDDPVSQGVNETLGGVKDTLGRLTGKP